MKKLSQETATAQALINNLERKCQLYVQGIEDEKKKLETLTMEARLTDSGAKLGQEAAFEETQSQLAELQGLQACLVQETSRKAQAMEASQAYNKHESVAMKHMTELLSLTECMRKITKDLRQCGPSMHKDPTQRAVDEEVMLLHNIEDVHQSRPMAAL